MKNELPIDAFRDDILTCIEENQVSIIVAETGAGKSTRIPQFLLEETDYEIVVTQPRRIAAKSVAKRVAEEMNCEFGGLVGFRTSVDRNDTNETRCLFVTDGLQLVREITKARQSISKGVVLVVDEVHEWNINIETLVAWIKKAITEGIDIKVVLMSATLDHERLSQFFNNAPVVTVPGRCFPVIGAPKDNDVFQVYESQMVDEIKRLAESGRNTLVFLPGKSEITAMQKELESRNLQAVILQLHGEMDIADQELIFNSYKLSKVVLSTNIAQTSITIPDIDAVVDSGLERRIELINGVETLKLANISKADCLQRAGRAGRVQEGEYVLCNDVDYSVFGEYPKPEILRTLLDQLVLRLAGAELDATTLPFYHQPDLSVLLEAKETLIAIEALDGNGAITELGKNINKFPTNVKAARMILEAIKRKCLAPVVTIASILGTQNSSIRRRPRKDDAFDFKPWEYLIDFNNKYQSDLLVELDIFRKAIDIKDLAKNGIMPKAYIQACEIRKQIQVSLDSIGYSAKDYYNKNSQNEEEILKSVASGMVGHLYNHSFMDVYVNGGNRKLSRDSVLKHLPFYPEWIVGEPKNILFKNNYGLTNVIELVTNATVVKPEWMIEIAPHLTVKSVQAPYWSEEFNDVVENHIVTFNGHIISTEVKLAVTSVYVTMIRKEMEKFSSKKELTELKYKVEEKEEDTPISIESIMALKEKFR